MKRNGLSTLPSAGFTTCLRRNEQGFSLIELAAAITFLAISLIGVGTLFISSKRSSETAREQAIVTHYFRYLTEKIRATPFRDIALTYNNYTFTIEDINAQGLVTVFLNETVCTTDAQKLGLPRDLNGDGAATSVDVSENYILLPIKIRVLWNTYPVQNQREHYFLLSQEE